MVPMIRGRSYIVLGMLAASVALGAQAPSADPLVAKTLRAGLPPDSTVSLLVSLLGESRYDEAARLFDLTSAEKGRKQSLMMVRTMVSRNESGFDIMAMSKAMVSMDKSAQTAVDTLHIPGIADSTVTIGSVARMPIGAYLAMGARLRNSGHSASRYVPVAVGIEKGDTIAHVIIRQQSEAPTSAKVQAMIDDLDRSQVLHLRRVDSRWLFSGQNVLMGPSDIQLGLMSSRMAANVGLAAPAGVSKVADVGSVGAATSTKVSCEPVNNPLFEFQVDQPARYIDDGKTSPKPMPRGDSSTLVQFVVDTAGVPVEKTYRVLKLASVEFTNDVLKVASTWRFEPAKKGGCNVPQLIQTPVVK
jgi:hypothetical protein